MEWNYRGDEIKTYLINYLRKIEKSLIYEIVSEKDKKYKIGLKN